MLNLYFKCSQTRLFLPHSDKVSDAAAEQEKDCTEPESKRRKSNNGKMQTEACTSCYSVSGYMMVVLTDSSSDLPHTSTTAEGGLVKTGERNNVAKAPVDGTKTDKMEESLTCVICQDLLHDCIRFVYFVALDGFEGALPFLRDEMNAILPQLAALHARLLRRLLLGLDGAFLSLPHLPLPRGEDS